jgi:mRNA interferase HigB
VFNIRGNRYRLIAWIKSQKLFIRHVLTHAEYDKGAWKNECFVS